MVAVALFCFTQCKNNTSAPERSATQKEFIAVPKSTCQDSFPSFALLELFSSEACYDCPEAEEFLNELVQGEKKLGRNVIPIPMHVDYWNDLVDGEEECQGNWNDPYSDARYTNRQFNYMHRMQGRPVTPQFVINGKNYINGAPKDTVEVAIENSLKSQALYGICIDLQEQKGSLLEVSFEAYKKNGVPAEFRKSLVAQVHILLLESALVSVPDKGENCGKTLKHDHIIRVHAAKTLYGSKKGSITLAIPEGVNLNNCTVVGFIQNLMDLEVVAATTGFDLRKKEL